MAETATIRVDRAVRDQLARAAAREGMSLAGLLTRYAREDMIQSERLAVLQAYQNREAMAEQEDWEATVDDGIS